MIKQKHEIFWQRNRQKNIKQIIAIKNSQYLTKFNSKQALSPEVIEYSRIVFAKLYSKWFLFQNNSRSDEIDRILREIHSTLLISNDPSQLPLLPFIFTNCYHIIKDSINTNPNSINDKIRMRILSEIVLALSCVEQSFICSIWGDNLQFLSFAKTCLENNEPEIQINGFLIIGNLAMEVKNEVCLKLTTQHFWKLIDQIIPNVHSNESHCNTLLWFFTQVVESINLSQNFEIETILSFCQLKLFEN